MATTAVEIDPVQVSRVASKLAQEQRERLRRARISGEETVQVPAVKAVSTARLPVAGRPAWPGGPPRPTFATDPDHRTVELPMIERYDVRVARTAALIEAEVLRFWQRIGKRPVAVCMSPLRILTIRSQYWQRYPVLLLGSTITVELVALSTIGDDEALPVLGMENPDFYLCSIVVLRNNETGHTSAISNGTISSKAAVTPPAAPEEQAR